MVKELFQSFAGYIVNFGKVGCDGGETFPKICVVYVLTLEKLVSGDDRKTFPKFCGVYSLTLEKLVSEILILSPAFYF